MPRHAALIVVVLLAGCGSAVLTPAQRVNPNSAPTSGTSPAHSMWMWTVNPYPRVGKVMTWAKNHQVKNIFLAVQTTAKGGVTNSGDVVKFGRAARANGINLYALNGDPSWILHPSEVTAWETAVMHAGAFAGIHLDTEPNEVAGWKASDKPGALAEDGPIMKKMYAMIAALRANRRGTNLEIDVQFSDSSYTRARGFPCHGFGSFGEALVALTDELTVMSYRTTVTGPNGVHAISAPMLALAAAHGKPMRLAIETTKDQAEPQDSFYGQTQMAVAAMLDAVDANEARSPAYAGTSVEDYIAWTKLVRSRKGSSAGGPLRVGRSHALLVKGNTTQ